MTTPQQNDATTTPADAGAEAKRDDRMTFATVAPDEARVYCLAHPEAGPMKLRHCKARCKVCDATVDLCGDVFGRKDCIREVDHGGFYHVSRSGSAWPVAAEPAVAAAATASDNDDPAPEPTAALVELMSQSPALCRDTDEHLVHYAKDDTWSLVLPAHGGRGSRNLSVPRAVGRAWSEQLPVREEPEAYGTYPWGALDRAAVEAEAKHEGKDGKPWMTE